MAVMYAVSLTTTAINTVDCDVLELSFGKARQVYLHSTFHIQMQLNELHKKISKGIKKTRKHRQQRLLSV